MEVELLKRKAERPNIYSFVFSRPPGFSYEAGDFIELSFDYPGGGGRRWFTLSSTPRENFLQITTKYPPHPSQFKQELLKQPIGGTFFISPAIGQFNLPRGDAENLLFVAGGIGITPFRSMLLHPSAKNHDITLVYTAPEDEHIFTDELDSAPANTTYHTSRPKHLSMDTVAEQAPDWRSRTIYLSGPEPMIQKLAMELQPHVAPYQIRLDYFPGYTDL